MAAANITFNDGTSATLTALSGSGRFNNWTPDVLPLDDFAERVGSGAIDTFELRDRGGMTFEFPIPNTALDTALRLQKHLWRGGLCTVNTQDRTATPLVYADMGIMVREGQRVAMQISMGDRETVDYLVTIAVEYKGASTVPRPVVLY